jgi:ABC-2 type transport system permease protein
MQRLINYLGLVSAYFRLNLNAQMEYRTAFISQILAMFINDGVWLAFWWLFFSRFPVLNGWDIKDVITVWSVTAGGFGLAHAVFGNALPLASIISQGQLDVWMLYPRSLLPHLLLGRMSASAIGDALFGLVAYIVLVQPDAAHFLLFLLMLLSTATLFLGFSILSASLAFFLGSAAQLSEQWRFALITFSTYPMSLFDGFAKIILFTLIPAAFISGLPIEALRNLNFGQAGLACAGAVAVLALGVGAFYLGLRRYESGNLLEMRS